MPLHAQKIPCLLSYDFKKNGEIFNWNTYHGYTKFLVMRDPYDRLVSYYSNRFLRQFIQRKAKQSSTITSSATQYFLSNLSISNQHDAITLSDISFKTMIEKMYAQYHTHGKVWDVHIALQVTGDFKDVALEEALIIDITQMSELFAYWHKKNANENLQIDLNQNTSSTKDAKIVPRAYDMTTQELSELKHSIHPYSFRHPKLEKLIKEMYATDYEVWDKITPLPFDEIA